jgi:hypothetical protein
MAVLLETAIQDTVVLEQVYHQEIMDTKVKAQSEEELVDQMEIQK